MRITGSTCLLAVLLGCSSGSGDNAAGSQWQLVHENLEAALMSVAGTSATNVYAVGANTPDGQGSLILHFDGERWRRIATDSHADLWWLLVLDQETVFAAGSEGTVVRLNTKQDRFETMETPGNDRTVFGIWGTREDDLIAVGGEPDESPGFAWRYDGESWRDVSEDLPQGKDGPVLFKIWGTSATDAWLVGMDGALVHWDGERFEADEGDDGRRMFTVHGAPSGQPRFVAVGGFGRGVILEHDGERWRDVTPEESPTLGAVAQLFGVYMHGPEDGYAVGLDGAMLRRDEHGWSRLEPPVELFLSFHAVWIDPGGGVWAVGGDVVTPALDQGMLLHHGARISNTMQD